MQVWELAATLGGCRKKGQTSKVHFLIGESTQSSDSCQYEECEVFKEKDLLFGTRCQIPASMPKQAVATELQHAVTKLYCGYSDVPSTTANKRSFIISEFKPLRRAHLQRGGSLAEVIQRNSAPSDPYSKRLPEINHLSLTDWSYNCCRGGLDA